MALNFQETFEASSYKHFFFDGVLSLIYPIDSELALGEEVVTKLAPVFLINFIEGHLGFEALLSL